MSQTPLNLGILGCANIARQFIRDVQASHLVRIVAVASRSAENAAAFARENGVGRSVGSYEALLADAGIDAVYIPLPNSLHAEWTIRSLVAGKHVLCEKPLAVNLEEASAMVAAARRQGLVLMECIPYLFQPQTAALTTLLTENAIGEVRSVQAGFTFTVTNPATNIRMKPALGGGALLDAGSYPLSLIRLVMGKAPVRVRADATWDGSGVDIAMMATLQFDDGRRAQLSCAMNAAYHRFAAIAGSAGAIETDFVNHTSNGTDAHPWGYLPGRLCLRRGTATTVPLEEIRSPSGSGFLFAAESFARIVAARDLPAVAVAAEASMDNAATLEALARSARSGKPAEVACWRGN